MLSSPTTIINGEDYVAGMLGRNNPSSLALEELESDTWESPLMDVVYEVGCFVSIGTGRPIFRGPGDALRKRFTLKGVTAVQNALSICSQVTTDSHAEHMKVMKRYVPLSSVINDGNVVTYTFSALGRPGGRTYITGSTLTPAMSPIYGVLDAISGYGAS